MSHAYTPTVISPPAQFQTALDCIDQKAKERNQALIDSLLDSKTITLPLARFIMAGVKLHNNYSYEIIDAIIMSRGLYLKYLAYFHLIDSDTLYHILRLTPTVEMTKILFYWVNEDFPIYERDLKQILHIIKKLQQEQRVQDVQTNDLLIRQNLYTVQDRIFTKGTVIRDL